MLLDEIKKLAQEKQTYVFFDMDGVLAEFDATVYQKIKKGEADVFLKTRPIKTTIKFAKKLRKIKNVQVCIMSNCYSKIQKKDKIVWLSKHLPFINKENINIIVYEEVKFKKEEKDLLKGNFLTEKYKDKAINMFLIEVPWYKIRS